MNRNQIAVVCAFLLDVVSLSVPSMADTFGNGANSFDITFVTIGNPGNPADTTAQPSPAGSVPYSYRIGKYEISEQMIDKANALGALGITKDARGPDMPATSLSWYEAARFVNWLNTSTEHAPAYKFVPIPPPRPGGVSPGTMFALWEPSDPGYDPANRFRNKQAMYFLPSANEWYKAAFYDPIEGVYYDYPTGSNAPPIAVAIGNAPGTAVYNQALSAGPADIMQAGGLSPYGTMAQGGNIEEWEETELDLVNDTISALRGRRGGFWEFSPLSSSFRNAESPSIGLFGVGFRVASVVPEPESLGLLVMCLISLILRTRRSFRRRSFDAQHSF